MTVVRLSDGILFNDVRSLTEFTKAWQWAIKNKEPIKLHRKSPEKVFVNPFQILYFSND